MNSSSFPSATLTSTATSLSRNGLIETPFGYSQFLKFPSLKKHPLAKNLKLVDFRAPASGAIKIRSEAVGETPKKADLKDNDLAFVAGATGKVGSRTVRELLKLGYRVRAGVRSAQRAQDLVQSVKRMRIDPKIAEEGTQAVEKLEIVECDLEKPSQIGPALGNASVVLCCIGASEKEVFDITGPYRIDYQATKNLIDAATAAKVNHFIMVSSLGTNKVGFPAAILNLFWGVLIWKRKAEEALIASGLPYTIVRPGGMERPTDAYKETHNITLSQEDTLFGGQVSNLQVAELMACMARNRSLSYCKVVEVIAETTAPLIPMEELLSKIPSHRAEPKDSRAAGGSGPASLKSTIPGEPSVPVKKETDEPKSEALQSLSPYSTYEDSKLPKSPTVTPSTTSGASKTSELDATPTASVASTLSDSSSTTLEKEATQEGVKKTRPLSPYFLYDDLKQPTSPTPTPPAGQKDLTTVDGLSTTGVSDIQTGTTEITFNVTETIPAPKATIDVPEKVPAPEVPHKRPLSPYYAYEDLKPPSSPSPTPSGPQGIPSSTSTLEAPSPLSGGNDLAKTTVASVTEESLSQNSTYHLSPYYNQSDDYNLWYEDMKPPTSPSPSPRKS